MSDEPQTRECHECGASMVYETRQDEVTYKGRVRKVETLGWWCTKCHEAVFTGEALLEYEKAYLAFRDEVRNETEWDRIVKQRVEARRAGTATSTPWAVAREELKEEMRRRLDKALAHPEELLTSDEVRERCAAKREAQDAIRERDHLELELAEKWRELNDAYNRIEKLERATIEREFGKVPGASGVEMSVVPEHWHVTVYVSEHSTELTGLVLEAEDRVLKEGIQVDVHVTTRKP